MGAAVNALPGGEIVPAMDRGLLDGAEFNNATSDRILGFPDVSKVCMLQSYHQSAETFEITFNKPKYEALPAKMKAIIANAVEAASADMSWKAIDRYSKDYIELQTKDKVKFYKTPDTVLQAQLKLWDADPREEVGREPAVQGNRRVAEGLRRARGEVGPGHLRQPAHGGGPLLRPQDGRAQEGLSGSADRQSAIRARSGWPIFLSGRNMQKLLLTIDKISTFVGQAFSWLIVALTFLISWEVFSRYVLDHPHSWAFDVMIMMYGTLFMMAGAYTLAKAGHVRGDVLYGFFRPRTQATIDLILYIIFFIPGVFALTYAGYYYAAESWAIREHSNITAEGPPIYPFKTMLPLAGAFLLAAGHRRDHPLRHLHQAGRVAVARGGRARKSTSTSSRRWCT